jgi:hypothetical protein
LGCIP